MANLPESSTFDAGVYQIELTDPVIGGPSGVTNAPLKNLANRTKYLKDHVDALESSRAPLASPAFTGTPTAPTAAVGTSTTQLATTAFVQNEIAADISSALATAAPVMDGTAAVGVATKLAREDHRHPSDTSRAPLASPAFTGTPTAPTAAQGTNTTQVATTAFVNAEIAADAAPVAHVGATGAAHGVATTAVAGFMAAADKTALDSLAAGFAVSKSASGYQKLPSGLIIQWGSTLTLGNGDGGISVAFPIAFPTACVAAFANSRSDNSAAIVGSVSTTSLSGSSIDASTGANLPAGVGVFWLAIGY